MALFPSTSSPGWKKIAQWIGKQMYKATFRRGCDRAGRPSCCSCRTIDRDIRREIACDTCDTVCAAADKMCREEPSSRCSTPRRPRSACPRSASTAAVRPTPNRSKPQYIAAQAYTGFHNGGGYTGGLQETITITWNLWKINVCSMGGAWTSLPPSAYATA